MDEVRIIKKRTHIWPVVLAVVVLALVIAFVLFTNYGAGNHVGWNGIMNWPLEADAALG